jgi:hypothetical protein
MRHGRSSGSTSRCSASHLTGSGILGTGVDRFEQYKERHGEPRDTPLEHAHTRVEFRRRCQRDTPADPRPYPLPRHNALTTGPRQRRTLTAWPPNYQALELQEIRCRSLAFIERGACRLVSRTGHIYKRFSDLRVALPADITGDTILDGEVVLLDDEGRTLFNEVLRSKALHAFAAFDVLAVDGDDLQELPPIERKKRGSSGKMPSACCTSIT